MDWFAKNSAAIQAIASIVGVIIAGVLAGVTYWYVRLTQEIARSSAEQVKQMREAAALGKMQERENQRQLLQALQVLAKRSRASIQATQFSYAGLRVFAQPTDVDVDDLERMSRQTGNDKISASMNRAIIGLRHILPLVAKVRDIHPGLGWIPSSENQRYWQDAVNAAAQGLQELEEECARLLKQEADLKKKTAAV